MEEEGREAIDRVLEEDQRAFEQENERKLQDLVESDAEADTIEHVGNVIENENDRHRRENIAHLDWVWQNVNTHSHVYRIRKVWKEFKSNLSAGSQNR